MGTSTANITIRAGWVYSTLDGRCSSSTTRRYAGASGMLLGMQAATGRVDTAILGEVKVHAAIIPSARQEKERESHAADEEQIEDAKKDHATRNPNDITTFRDGKGNRVEEPEKVHVAREPGVIAADVETAGG